MRESAVMKGRRYVAEGRLVVERVDEEGIRARSRGGGETYELGWNGETWWCSCPARTRCSHLVALQLVTDVRAADETPETRDSERPQSVF